MVRATTALLVPERRDESALEIAGAGSLAVTVPHDERVEIDVCHGRVRAVFSTSAPFAASCLDGSCSDQPEPLSDTTLVVPDERWRVLAGATHAVTFFVGLEAQDGATLVVRQPLLATTPGIATVVLVD